MSKAVFLAALLGLLVAASAADFAAKPPHFRHGHMPPADAPRPHDHEHRRGQFAAHPPRMAGAPDHMPHNHHHGRHYPGGVAHPPMTGHGHGPHGKTVPPAHAPHMHPRHHRAPAPVY